MKTGGRLAVAALALGLQRRRLLAAAWRPAHLARARRAPRRPPPAWLAMLALGLLPLALGHTLYNAGLRRTRAAYVNVLAAQEVTGGVLLTWLLLGLAPAPHEILGGLIALLGILLVLL